MKRQMLLILFVLPCAAAMLAQGELKGPADLQQLIHLEQQETFSSAYVGDILLKSGLRGGVEAEMGTCAPQSIRIYPEFRGTVQEAFESVTAPGGGAYRWTKHDGAILVRNIPEQQSLLDTPLTTFTFRENESPLRVADRLFNLPEVRRQARDLKLHERGPELGFTSAQRAGGSPNAVVLRNLTLRDALMKVVVHNGGRLVWTYTEYTCSAKKYSRFDWLAR